MTVELGHFALVLALFVAMAQAGLPLIGAARHDSGLMAFGRTAALSQMLLIGLAFGCFVAAHVTSDFSVLNVVLNSHSSKPLLYKIAGAWGNHEGSMLLWVLILALFGGAVAVFGGNLPPGLRARTLAIQGALGMAFLAFILFTSNPFARVLPAPLDGRGLNPLLQDPGLAFHPPFLYLGYVGFSIAFAFAIAALIEGRVDPGWARWVRPWTLAAWCFLTIGIGLGSWWSYYELGWGGWWFWDPVENASLLPWLAGTALLHSAVVVEKRDALKGWTVFLAILTFGFSLLGTFLVRSGVLTSVHAFATDPARGIFILGLLVVVIGGSLALFAWRGPNMAGGGLFQPISREGGLLLNNLLLSTAAASVLLGTLYPLILETLGDEKISVGPPFFNAVFIPIMVPLVVAMAIGPFLAWKRADVGEALRRLRLALALAVGVVVALGVVLGVREPLGLLGLGLATWLLAGTLSELATRVKLGHVSLRESSRRLARLPRAAWGMTLAHAGLAVLIAGMTASAVWKTERIERMVPGDQLAISGYVLTFEGAGVYPGPNYQALRGTLTVSTADGRALAVLQPERRRYPVEGQETTEAAIRSTALGDLYAVIGESRDDTEGYVVRAYFNPLVPWIWCGLGIMVVGGAVSLTDRRLRVGAPARQPRRTAARPAEMPT